MPRAIKPPSEVHPAPAAEPNESPEPQFEVVQPEPPTELKKPSVRFQINQISDIVFLDKSEYKARLGIHELTDETTIKNLTAWATQPGTKRAIFRLDPEPAATT